MNNKTIKKRKLKKKKRKQVAVWGADLLKPVHCRRGSIRK
jgi:hypothetical protein